MVAGRPGLRYLEFTCMRDDAHEPLEYSRKMRMNHNDCCDLLGGLMSNG